MTKQRFKSIEAVAEFFGLFNVGTRDPVTAYLVDKTKTERYPNCQDPRSHDQRAYFSEEMLIEEANRIAMGVRDLHDWNAARIPGFSSCVEMAINQEKDPEFIARIHAKYP
jgi:hypothetical protein